MSEENLSIIRQVWDAWNAHDPDRHLKLLDENHVVESDTIPGPVVGRAAFRDFMLTYLTAFPDLHFDIEQMIACGDYVITQFTATGTHRGELPSIPPTYQAARARGCSVAELQNGKQIRVWVYWDTGHLLRQLGVLPAY